MWLRDIKCMPQSTYWLRDKRISVDLGVSANAFGCMPQDLFIAKVKPCGFPLESPKALQTVSSSRRQSIETHATYSNLA